MEFDYTIDTEEDMMNFLTMLDNKCASQKDNCTTENLKDLI